MLRLVLSRLQRFGECESGSSLIEFAASAIVLFTMLAGTMTMSQAVYTYHYVSEAAREGSRYAIVNGSSVASPATSTSIQTWVQGRGYPGIKSSLLTVSTTWSAYPTGVPCTPSTTCNNPSNLVTVKASYAYPLSIPYLGTKTLNMSSTSSMVISQ